MTCLRSLGGRAGTKVQRVGLHSHLHRLVVPPATDLGTFLKCKLVGSAPDLWNQKLGIGTRDVGCNKHSRGVCAFMGEIHRIILPYRLLEQCFSNVNLHAELEMQTDLVSLGVLPEVPYFSPAPGDAETDGLQTLHDRM